MSDISLSWGADRTADSQNGILSVRQTGRVTPYGTEQVRPARMVLWHNSMYSYLPFIPSYPPMPFPHYVSQLFKDGPVLGGSSGKDKLLLSSTAISLAFFPSAGPSTVVHPPSLFLLAYLLLWH
jgi:hypothetical protein